MIYTLEPTLSRKFLLSQISEESIMEHYLGLIPKKGLFKSPFRHDKHATCSFYRNKKGTLIFKDWAGYFYGDAISVVMYKYDCTYDKALCIIANDFGLISSNLPKNEALIPYSNKHFKETEPTIIQVEIKDFSDNELEYWSSFGITEKTLKKYKIYSCKNVFLNGKVSSLYKPNQLIFGYYGGIKNNIEQWRIYYPGRKKYKFISNWSSKKLQGAHMLPKTGDEYLVISKALKDVCVFYELGISAVAPTSENSFITENQFNKIKSKFKKIILFYDSDLAGISNMNKFYKANKELYVCWIPRKYKAKDISDFYKMYGKDKTVELINEAKQLIDEEEKKRNQTYGKV